MTGYWRDESRIAPILKAKFLNEPWCSVDEKEYAENYLGNKLIRPTLQPLQDNEADFSRVSP